MKNPWRRAKARWVAGNQIELLENGEGFYPAVFEAIAGAQREVVIETFILFEDKVGLALHEVLLAAAKRGVRIDLMVDGYGSPDLSATFVSMLTQAGVKFRVFDPAPRLLGMRTNVFRRMHRKIVVVDGTVAFVGGINFSADHLGDFGPEAKQDYAVRVRGPLVDQIHRFAYDAIAPAEANTPRMRWPFQRRDVATPDATTLPSVGPAQAMFITRDNHEHRDDIERHYRIAIRAARKEVLIANAYFFPGYRLLKEMRRAARRGVRVRLILQGEPDMPIVKTAAELLHDHLIRAGVEIYEYCQRPLHGKVALTDDEWSTVGSSNLDPLSLALNLEANVVIRDRAFNAHLRERLEDLVCHHCKQVTADQVPKRTLFHVLRGFVVFHVLRRFPAWAGWFPAHKPALVIPQHSPVSSDPATENEDSLRRVGGTTLTET